MYYYLYIGHSISVSPYRSISLWHKKVKVKARLVLHMCIPPSAALSSQTGPAFSRGRSRPSPHTWTLTFESCDDPVQAYMVVLCATWRTARRVFDMLEEISLCCDVKALLMYGASGDRDVEVGA